MRAAALLLTIAIPALASPRAASAESARIDDQPLRSALLLALIPGGGHFYLGESEAGATYAGTILPLIGGGVWLDRSNDRLGRDEINTLGPLALKEWELSLFTTYRSARRLQGYDLESIGIDDAPVKDLFLSPFRRESYSDPMVAFAALLGAASAAYESRHSRRALGDIWRVGILGIDGAGTLAPPFMESTPSEFLLPPGWAKRRSGGVSFKTRWRGGWGREAGFCLRRPSSGRPIS